MKREEYQQVRQLFHELENRDEAQRKQAYRDRQVPEHLWKEVEELFRDLHQSGLLDEEKISDAALKVFDALAPGAPESGPELSELQIQRRFESVVDLAPPERERRLDSWPKEEARRVRILLQAWEEWVQGSHFDSFTERASRTVAEWSRGKRGSSPRAFEGKVEDRDGDSRQGNHWDLDFHRPLRKVTANRKAAAELVREARITARLDHPSVRPVHGLRLDSQDNLSFTCPLDRGKPLEFVYQQLSSHPTAASVASAVRTLRRVCETLSFAHSRGIAHGSLNASHIRVGEFGEVFVSHWRKAEEATPDSESKDLASLARLLERLCHAAGDRTSPELRAIARKAGQESAGYSSPGELAKDLEALLDQRVVQAHRTGPIAQLQKWIMRNRPFAAVLGAVILAAFVSMVVIAWNQILANQKLQREADLLQETTLTLQSAQGRLQETLEASYRLSDPFLLAALVKEADTLWPRREAQVPGCQSWLARLKELEERLPIHRDALAGHRQPPREDEPIGASEHKRQTEQFVRRMEEILGNGGLKQHVEQRITIADQIETETLRNAADDWEFAIEEIRDLPVYQGIELEPTLGLIPLDRDPVSDLWEFLVWETGEPPERDPETEQWIITEQTGIVLVLLPGGEFEIGANQNPAHPRYDPGGESPVQPVQLDPFFLSKYEMTQGQWERTFGFNRETARRYVTGEKLGEQGQMTNHPVGKVTWAEALRAAARLGLLVPTSAQWEYACRAGTDTRWFCGSEESLLPRYANLLESETHQDGFRGSSPVGSFLPNPFGLHDVIGNAREWVQDRYATYKVPTRPGDGFRVAPPMEHLPSLPAIMRGGGFQEPPELATSAKVAILSPQFTWATFGLRLAAGCEEGGE